MSFDSEQVFNNWLKVVQVGRKEPKVARPTSFGVIGKREDSLVTETQDEPIASSPPSPDPLIAKDTPIESLKKEKKIMRMPTQINFGVAVKISNKDEIDRIIYTMCD